MSRSVTERSEEDIAGNWGCPLSLSNIRSTVKATGLGWPLGEGIGRSVGGRCISWKYFRGPTCGNDRATEWDSYEQQ